MNKLYILEQKIATLEIILESIVEELIETELVNRKKLDFRIIERIKELSNEVKDEEKQIELLKVKHNLVF
jgi:predicted 2-oxoglutarate/Fe(II)-dependent dioxygenase YbiX